MAFIAKIRKHSGFLVGIVIVGFLLTFLINSGSISFFSFITQKSRSQIGSVAGKSISKEDYEMQLRLIKSRFPSKNSSDRLLQNQAWYTLIQKYILQKEYNDLAIFMTDLEAIDIIQGNNIHPKLKMEPAFCDGETKIFDKRKLISYLQKLPELSQEEQHSWYLFEKSIVESRKFDKLLSILTKSAYLTSLDFQSIYNRDRKEVIINYLYIPYSNIDVDNIQISDSEIKTYINEHKATYQVEESMKIKYVVFNIEPSEQDVINFNSEIDALCKDFIQTKDDIIFAKANTDGDVASVSLKFDSDSIPNILREENLKIGTIIGPVDLGNTYKIYKVSKVAQDKSKTFYDISVIEKKLIVGDQSKNASYANANKCANHCKKFVDLEKWALNEAIPIEEATVTKNETRLHNKENARSLIHWLYNNKIGTISSVFEVENSYIIAVAIEKINKGTTPTDMVRDEVIRKLENKYKSERIIEKLNSTGVNSLHTTREICDFEASLVENYSLKFSNNILPEAGVAAKAIGTAFSLSSIGEKRIIADDYGVFVIELLKRDNTPNKYPDELELNIIRSTKAERDLYTSFLAMEELANVIDNRYLFY